MIYFYIKMVFTIITGDLSRSMPEVLCKPTGPSVFVEVNDTTVTYAGWCL
jgi:hypothetical protein